MKFSDGMWQVRAGFTLEAPACSYAGHYDDHSVTLYGPYRPVTHRGMTLNVGQMTVTLRSPMEGVIAVKMENFIIEILEQKLEKIKTKKLLMLLIH